MLWVCGMGSVVGMLVEYVVDMWNHGEGFTRKLKRKTINQKKKVIKKKKKSFLSRFDPVFQFSKD